MIFTKPVVYVLGAVLAVAEAVQIALHLGGYWHAAISMAIVALGTLGVQALSPAQIAAKIPVHVATIATAVVGALEVFQNANLSMPTGVHIAIGVIIVIASTVGIQVTGVVQSRSARTASHRTRR